MLAHRDQWVEERSQHGGSLQRLSADEQELFAELVANKHGDRVRLEQERVGFGHLASALRT